MCRDYCRNYIGKCQFIDGAVRGTISVLFNRRPVMKKYILMIVLAVCGIVGIIATLPIITKILVVVACIFGIFEVAQMSDESFRK